MVIPTMISGRTKQSQAFVDDLEATYPDVAAAPVAESQNIGNLQGEGKTLFAVDEDELYATGQRAREAYSANAATLIDTIHP
jgi:chromosome partitioning protein